MREDVKGLSRVIDKAAKGKLKLELDTASLEDQARKLTPLKVDVAATLDARSLESIEKEIKARFEKVNALSIQSEAIDSIGTRSKKAHQEEIHMLVEIQGHLKKIAELKSQYTATMGSMSHPSLSSDNLNKWIDLPGWIAEYETFAKDVVESFAEKFKGLKLEIPVVDASMDINEKGISGKTQEYIKATQKTADASPVNINVDLSEAKRRANDFISEIKNKVVELDAIVVPQPTITNAELTAHKVVGSDVIDKTEEQHNISALNMLRQRAVLLRELATLIQKLDNESTLAVNNEIISFEKLNGIISKTSEEIKRHQNSLSHLTQNNMQTADVEVVINTSIETNQMEGELLSTVKEAQVTADRNPIIMKAEFAGIDLEAMFQKGLKEAEAAQKRLAEFGDEKYTAAEARKHIKSQQPGRSIDKEVIDRYINQLEQEGRLIDKVTAAIKRERAERVQLNEVISQFSSLVSGAAHSITASDLLPVSDADYNKVDELLEYIKQLRNEAEVAKSALEKINEGQKVITVTYEYDTVIKKPITDTGGGFTTSYIEEIEKQINTISAYGKDLNDAMQKYFGPGVDISGIKIIDSTEVVKSKEDIEGLVTAVNTYNQTISAFGVTVNDVFGRIELPELPAVPEGGNVTLPVLIDGANVVSQLDDVISSASGKEITVPVFADGADAFETVEDIIKRLSYGFSELPGIDTTKFSKALEKAYGDVSAGLEKINEDVRNFGGKYTPKRSPVIREYIEHLNTLRSAAIEAQDVLNSGDFNIKTLVDTQQLDILKEKLKDAQSSYEVVNNTKHHKDGDERITAFQEAQRLYGEVLVAQRAIENFAGAVETQISEFVAKQRAAIQSFKDFDRGITHDVKPIVFGTPQNLEESGRVLESFAKNLTNVNDEAEGLTESQQKLLEILAAVDKQFDKLQENHDKKIDNEPTGVAAYEKWEEAVERLSDAMGGLKEIQDELTLGIDTKDTDSIEVARDLLKDWNEEYQKLSKTVEKFETLQIDTLFPSAESAASKTQDIKDDIENTLKQTEVAPIDIPIGLNPVQEKELRDSVQFIRDTLADGAENDAIAALERQIKSIVDLRARVQSSVLPDMDRKSLPPERITAQYQDAVNGYSNLHNKIQNMIAMVKEFASLSNTPLSLQLSIDDMQGMMEEAKKQAASLQDVLSGKAVIKTEVVSPDAVPDIEIQATVNEDSLQETENRLTNIITGITNAMNSYNSVLAGLDADAGGGSFDSQLIAFQKAKELLIELIGLRNDYANAGGIGLDEQQLEFIESLTGKLRDIDQSIISIAFDAVQTIDMNKLIDETEQAIKAFANKVNSETDPIVLPAPIVDEANLGESISKIIDTLTNSETIDSASQSISDYTKNLEKLNTAANGLPVETGLTAVSTDEASAVKELNDEWGRHSEIMKAADDAEQAKLKTSEDLKSKLDDERSAYDALADSILKTESRPVIDADISKIKFSSNVDINSLQDELQKIFDTAISEQDQFVTANVKLTINENDEMSRAIVTFKDNVGKTVQQVYALKTATEEAEQSAGKLGRSVAEAAEKQFQYVETRLNVSYGQDKRFNAGHERSLAEQEIKTLEARAKGLNVVFDDLRNAAANITDSSSLAEYNHQWDLVKEKIDTAKAELQSIKQLDTVAAMQRKIENFGTDISNLTEDLKQLKLTGFQDMEAEAFGKLEASIESAIIKLQTFKNTHEGLTTEAKVAAFDGLIKSIKNAENQYDALVRQQSTHKKELKDYIAIIKDVGKLHKQLLATDPSDTGRVNDLNRQFNILQAKKDQYEANEKIKFSESELLVIAEARRKAEDELNKSKAVKTKLSDTKIAGYEGDVRKVQASFEKLSLDVNTDAYKRANQEVDNLNAAIENLKCANGTEKQEEAQRSFNEQLKVTRQLIQEQTRQNIDTAGIQRLKENLDQLAYRLDTMNINWSAFRADPALVEKWDMLKGRIEEVKLAMTQAQEADDISKYRELSQAYSDLNQKVRTFSAEMKSMGLAQKSFADRVAETSQRLSAYLLSFFSFHHVISILRNGYQAIKDIDKAMTALIRVTNESSHTYDKFLTNAYDRAKKLGTGLDKIIVATADFARLGYSLSQAEKLGDAASVYFNVGNIGSDVLTMQEAVSSIVSTMKAFKIEAEDSITIVDKFNDVGNKFAISSKGIGDALFRSASSLAAANNTLDESIGLIVASNNVIQNPEVKTA